MRSKSILCFQKFKSPSFYARGDGNLMSILFHLSITQDMCGSHSKVHRSMKKPGITCMQVFFYGEASTLVLNLHSRTSKGQVWGSLIGGPYSKYSPPTYLINHRYRGLPLIGSTSFGNYAISESRGEMGPKVKANTASAHRPILPNKEGP